MPEKGQPPDGPAREGAGCSSTFGIRSDTKRFDQSCLGLHVIPAVSGRSPDTVGLLVSTPALSADGGAYLVGLANRPDLRAKVEM
jgi:hypothetical protein